jgi:hypothetical protein
MSLQSRVYGFIPTSITGCALWLDGADPAGNGVVPANNAIVSTWVDKSGNSKNGSQVNNPTYDLARKAIYFTGSSQYYTLPDSTFPTGNTSYSYFIIVNFTGLGTGSGTPTWAGVLGGGGFTPSTSIAFRTNGAGGGFYEYWYANDNFSSTTYATNEIVSIETIYTSGGQRSLIQNFSIFTTTTPSTPRNQSAGNNVIGRTFSTEYMIGYIHEVIVYNSALGTTERQQVEAYLSQKWGLKSSLPLGHPGLTTTIYRSDFTKQNVMTARPFYTAFSPRQISGCSLWMDGADSSTMTTASSYISAWNSKGINALSFTQATSSQQPLLVNNVYNGNSVVRCINPGNNVVNVNIATVNNALLQTGASFCIFIVHNPTIANGSPFCFQNGGGNRISCHLTENGNVVLDTPNIRLTYAAPGNYLTTGLKLDVFWSVANAINYRASGTATASASASPSSWSDGTLTFGSFTPTQTSYYYQTDIGEIIWFNTALALTQVQQVESYLAQKWGLTASLPGGHSHATQPAGAITLTALTNFRTLSQPRRYTSFRWTITAGTTESLIQFSEFQVGFNSTQIVFASPTTATTGSSISWNTGAGEGPTQAVDNNLNTKGLGIGTSGLVLIVTVATPIAPNMYRWATANDVTPGRNPTQWTVDGSADNSTYVRLHTQNTAYSTPNTTFTFTSWIPFTYT